MKCIPPAHCCGYAVFNKKLNIPTKKNVYSNVIQDNLKLGEGFKFANKRLGKFTKWNAAQ